MRATINGDGNDEGFSSFVVELVKSSRREPRLSQNIRVSALWSQEKSHTFLGPNFQDHLRVRDCCSFKGKVR